MLGSVFGKLDDRWDRLLMGANGNYLQLSRVQRLPTACCSYAHSLDDDGGQPLHESSNCTVYQ
jgi:hypothetical protein